MEKGAVKLSIYEYEILTLIKNGGENLDFGAVIRGVHEKLNDNWKPQVIATFIARLERNGFIKKHPETHCYCVAVME